MGDVGATALAEAVKATVLMCVFSSCSEHALVVATDVTSHGGVNSWRRQVDMQFVLLLLRFFLFLEGKPCVVRELFSS